jgi:hypothetical protein
MITSGKKIQYALHEELHAFLRVPRAKLPKYVLDRKVFQTEVKVR